MIVSIILLWVKYGNNQIPIKRKRAGTFKGSIYSQFPGESTAGRATQGKHWSVPQAERDRGTVGKQPFSGFCGKKRKKQGKQVQN